MSPAAAPSSGPAEAVVADAGPTLLERQLAMLSELAEIAMEVARSVGRRAAEQPAEDEADGKGPDLTLAFSRAARAVRLTLLLQTRLAEGTVGKAHGGAPGPLVSREARMARAQGHIERFVREEHGADAQAVERLSAEGAERLAEEEYFDEMPMGQIVALICNDLQLAPALVERALSLFDEDDARLSPSRDPNQRWEVVWLGAPPRPRRHPPPDEAEHGTGPPPSFADTLA